MSNNNNSYSRPKKCYVIYDAKGVNKCENISDDMKTEFGAERLEKLTDAFYNCYGRCPEKDQELRDYLKKLTDKAIGYIDEADSAFDEPDFVCDGHKCRPNPSKFPNR